MQINTLNKSDYAIAETLLKQTKLPYQDIYSTQIKLFEVSENDEIIAIGGYEFYNKDALLRSIAVVPDKQLKGTGSYIVDQLENLAMDSGVENLFLLTTTAESFFLKHGYCKINREEVPEAIKQSLEFSQLCPNTAICMTKPIKDKYVPKKLIVNSEITLKQIELNDAQAIFDIIDNQRSYLSRWLPFIAHTHSIKNTINFIQANIDTPKKEREFVFVMIYQNTLVGIIGFRDTDSINKKTEIGYWLSQNKQGKGIVTQSVDQLISFAFSDMELNRIQIKCAVGNTKSSNLPKRLNFQFEGIERDGEIFPDGSFKDLEVYSLLKSDYNR